MTEERPLPEPNSDELFSLLGPSNLRTLYGWLYRRRAGNSPTEAELQMFVADALGESPDDMTRLLRQLRRHFEVSWVGQPSSPLRCELRGWSETAPGPGELAISTRTRAQILAPQRCLQCGHTPKDHGAVLEIDFKIPQSWGGGMEIENLQPLCEQCMAGKRDYFQTYDVHADKIRTAINHVEPQKRIGELLKAFDGEWVRTDLLSIVASAQEFQEDWQRRLRDLRFLGWEIETRRRFNEGARVWTYYRLNHAEPWPPSIREALTSEERRRKAAKKQALARGT